MQALRLLMLVVVVALAYLLMLRPQTKTTDLPPDLTQPPTAAATGTPSAHSQYKEAMDRAHAAAKQMQAQHADADSL